MRSKRNNLKQSNIQYLEQSVIQYLEQSIIQYLEQSIIQSRIDSRVIQYLEQSVIQYLEQSVIQSRTDFRVTQSRTEFVSCNTRMASHCKKLLINMSLVFQIGMFSQIGIFLDLTLLWGCCPCATALQMQEGDEKDGENPINDNECADNDGIKGPISFSCHFVAYVA